MNKQVIDYLNTKLEPLDFFNKIYCLAEKIEREEKTYPAIYNTDNAYVEIELDQSGSIFYWRKSGDVIFSQQNNSTGIGIEYTASVPLKGVGFVKKDPSLNDQYFSDKMCLAIISNLTVNNSALKVVLKAKRATVAATKYSTDAKSVAQEEYNNINFEPRYTHAYFSIDFELNFVTNSQCYNELCNVQ